MTWLELFLCVVSVVVCQAIPRECSIRLDETRGERVTAWLNKLDEQNKLAGGFFLAQTPDGQSWATNAGHSDRTEGTEINEKTIFRVGELAQPIIAVALMTLVEKGKLTLDDHVSQWLPEFKEPKVLVQCHDKTAAGCDEDGYTTRPAKRAITIHDLLLHTSGIANDPFLSLRNHMTAAHTSTKKSHLAKLYKDRLVADSCQISALNLKQFVEHLADVPLLDDPGATYHPGSSTDVLMRVIEEITGEKIDKFLQGNIFEPLEMHDTTFHLSDADHTDGVYKRERLATVYVREETPTHEYSATPMRTAKNAAEEVRRYTDALTAATHSLTSACGLATTPEDYSKFLSMIARRGRPFPGQTRLLGPTSVDLLTHNHLSSHLQHLHPNHGRGYGFDIAPSDPIRVNVIATLGYIHGESLHNCFFFIDPKHSISSLFFTQNSALFGDKHVDWGHQLATLTSYLIDEHCDHHGEDPFTTMAEETGNFLQEDGMIAEEEGYEF